MKMSLAAYFLIQLKKSIALQAGRNVTENFRGVTPVLPSTFTFIIMHLYNILSI